MRSVLTTLTLIWTEHDLVATTPDFLPPVGVGSGWVAATWLDSFVTSGASVLFWISRALGSCNNKRDVKGVYWEWESRLIGVLE